MRATKIGLGLTALASLLCMSTSPTEAQGARRGPPIIRIYSDNGVDYVSTTSYITPRIELSENAYVFAVEMDMDGQIQVLHPDFPGLSVRIAANKSLQLPNFFAGFNSSRYGGTAYDASYSGYGKGIDDSRGTIIALASRAPFNLEKIESNGDWDISGIRQLIENRSPLSAAAALAQYLGQPGEPIGRDYLRFDGDRGNGYPYYADGYNYYSSCAGFYGYNILPFYAYQQLQAFALYSRARATGTGVRLLGFDGCGSPIYTITGGFSNGGQPGAFGHFPPPRSRGDTTVFPKSRLPRAPVPRGGTTVFANALDAGMPVTRQGALPRMGDVTVKAPTSRRGEPRVYLQDYNGGVSIPQGRMPVERVIVPRGEVSGGGMSAPMTRREPVVQSPPVSAPVIHERPSSPPPPPPRAEPSTRSDPPRQPPPSRGH